MAIITMEVRARKLALFCLALLLFFVGAQSAIAAPYGEGSYNEGDFGEGAPAAIGPTTTSSGPGVWKAPGCTGSTLYSPLTGERCSYTVSSSPLPQSGPVFTADISPGATSEEVRLLQRYLNTHGFPIAASGPGSLNNETLFFGPATKAAVIRFQIANGILPATGNVGPLTRAKLVETSVATAATAPSSATRKFAVNLSLGAVSEDIRMLQQYLNAHGFTVASSGPGSAGNETNRFGPATKEALIKFQIANNILPATGAFGPKTRAFISK